MQAFRLQLVRDRAGLARRTALRVASWMVICLSASAVDAQAVPDELVGCYRLTHAPWPEQNSHLGDHPVAERLRLAPERFEAVRLHPDGSQDRFVPTGYANVRVVEHPPGTLPNSFTIWEMEGDEIVIGRFWGGQHRLNVQPDGDRLRGRLTRSTDVIHFDKASSDSVEATLASTPCWGNG